ncbi:MAG: hypothetical protein P8170_23300 [Gemmatimonadota bacterium]
MSTRGFGLLRRLPLLSSSAAAESIRTRSPEANRPARSAKDTRKSSLRSREASGVSRRRSTILRASISPW